MWFLYIILAWIAIYWISFTLGWLLTGGLIKLWHWLTNRLKTKKEKQIKSDNSLALINQRIFELFSEEEKLYCLSAPTDAERNCRFLEIIATDTNIMLAFFNTPSKAAKTNPDKENTPK